MNQTTWIGAEHGEHDDRRREQALREADPAARRGALDEPGGAQHGDRLDRERRGESDFGHAGGDEGRAQRAVGECQR